MRSWNIRWMVALTLPLIMFTSLLIEPLAAHLFGQPIVLRTRPVDPRDLLYGDYVQLEYEIEQVVIKRTPAWDNVYANRAGNQRTIYVSLTNETPNQVKQVSLSKPTGGLYIESVIESMTGERWNEVTLQYEPIPDQYELTLSLPSEQYFVEEYTGLAIEEEARLGQALVKARLWRGYMQVDAVEMKRDEQNQ